MASRRMNSTHNMSGIGETSGLASDAKSTLSTPREMTRSGKCDVAAVSCGTDDQEVANARCR